MVSKSSTLAQRFWSHVNIQGPDDCWPWIGKINKKTGYGVVKVNGQEKRAHRVAFLLENGQDGEVVRHTCDNRPCCNPGHLIDGTQADNMMDMHARGRYVSRAGRPNK